MLAHPGFGCAWHTDYGTHAAAYAINAQILAKPAEVEALVERELSDAVTVCSWSPFNNYWILQALGNAGKMDQAAVRRLASLLLQVRH